MTKGRQKAVQVGIICQNLGGTQRKTHWDREGMPSDNQYLLVGSRHRHQWADRCPMFILMSSVDIVIERQGRAHRSIRRFNLSR